MEKRPLNGCSVVVVVVVDLETGMMLWIVIDGGS